MTRRNLVSEPIKGQYCNKGLHGKLGIVPIAVELMLCRLRLVKRMAEQIPRNDPKWKVMPLIVLVVMRSLRNGTNW